MSDCACSKTTILQRYCNACREIHNSHRFHNCKKCGKEICEWKTEIKLAKPAKGEPRGFYIFCQECYEKGDNGVKKE